eukprot:2361721-Alexandrium_andersonii.AAC.1
MVDTPPLARPGPSSPEDPAWPVLRFSPCMGRPPRGCGRPVARPGFPRRHGVKGAPPTPPGTAP